MFVGVAEVARRTAQEYDPVLSVVKLRVAPEAVIELVAGDPAVRIGSAGIVYVSVVKARNEPESQESAV